jgi:uncharacterized protein with PIN domain
MSTANLVFLGRLNDFLTRDRKGQVITVNFRGQQSIKHLCESLGVPHPEIGPVLVDGQESSLESIAKDNDKVEIHPVPNGCLIGPRFILDGHLGRLARHLRMLGFDCLYRNNYDDPELAETAFHEQRILLTRDRRLLMRKAITHGYCLRSLEPLEQLNEVIERFLLIDHISPFHRCLSCNHSLEPVSKEAILDRLEPLTQKYFDEFQICPACKQIYWKGSHYERMARLIARLRGDQAGE